MKKWISKNRQMLLRGAGSLLAIGLLVFLIAEQGWSEIALAVRQIPLWRFLLATALVFISRFFVVGRWHVLLRSADVDIPFSRSAALTFTGLFASNFLPTTIGGDVVRFAGAVEMGYNSSLILASLVADRLIGMAGMAMVVPFGLIPLWSSLTGKTAQAISLAALWAKGRDFVKNTFQALSVWFKKPLSLLGALGMTWGHMLCTFASVSVLLAGLNDPVPYWTIAGLWSIAYFVTLVPISINGYGVQEIAMTYLFTNAGGISMTNALTLAVLARVITMIASLPGAFYLPSVLMAIDKAKASSSASLPLEETGTGKQE
jgi:glycosyltransferase 2 family protein